jgi:hypothetical protein
MNFTESFDQFSSSLSTTDLALYAGVGLVVWVMFKNKLSPIQTLLASVIGRAKSVLNNVKPQVTVADTVVVPPVKPVVITEADKEDIFFKLIVSWKQTRDLAFQSGCEEAVRVADEMFPYISPVVCAKGKGKDIV